ncbi:hypothetical protein [Aquamicrobium sp. LC103]|uniref:hypothetical protein n=1 Tax=Aquamicrobium sp. LC103 TaxID=1120658 RepID=UPI000AEC7245|nr:hypothetical protein [Aquamicrobium sp. LC103]TKT78425.1 hypothetical protein XW59_012480 [Aquamicrobium sp. LC103]
MKISRYRLTPLGWLGAALFVLPTPLSVWGYNSALTESAAQSEYNRALGAVRGVPVLPEMPVTYLTALATASLIGLVLLLIGREIVTTD